MPMYDLKEYYSKTSGTLWQYYKYNSNHNLTDSKLFKSKIKGKTPNDVNEKMFK